MGNRITRAMLAARHAAVGPSAARQDLAVLSLEAPLEGQGTAAVATDGHVLVRVTDPKAPLGSPAVYRAIDADALAKAAGAPGKQQAALVGDGRAQLNDGASIPMVETGGAFPNWRNAVATWLDGEPLQVELAIDVLRQVLKAVEEFSKAAGHEGAIASAVLRVRGSASPLEVVAKGAEGEELWAVAMPIR